MQHRWGSDLGVKGRRSRPPKAAAPLTPRAPQHNAVTGGGRGKLVRTHNALTRRGVPISRYCQGPPPNEQRASWPEIVEPVRAPPPNPFSQPLALSKRVSPPTGHRRNHPDGRRSFRTDRGQPGLPKKSVVPHALGEALATSTRRHSILGGTSSSQSDQEAPNEETTPSASTKKTGPAEAKQATTLRPVRTEAIGTLSAKQAPI